MKDIYFKLRPELPTPNDEVCNCSDISDIYIAHKLGNNPIYCLRCNGEIPPEKLAIGEKLIESIASWNSVYGSLYRLWLDSGEYEKWARDCLLDPKGQVNSDGLEIVSELGTIARAYYLWFYENDEPTPKVCPLCNAGLITVEGRKFLMCESCSIVISIA